VETRSHGSGRSIDGSICNASKGCADLFTRFGATPSQSALPARRVVAELKRRCVSMRGTSRRGEPERLLRIHADCRRSHHACVGRLVRSWSAWPGNPEPCLSPAMRVSCRAGIMKRAPHPLSSPKITTPTSSPLQQAIRAVVGISPDALRKLALKRRLIDSLPHPWKRSPWNSAASKSDRPEETPGLTRLVLRVFERA